VSRPSAKNEILERAVQIASVQGLEGLSIGGLAAATGKSKGGICAHFPNKVNLQMAVVERAAEMFRAVVVDPALAIAPGLPRLVALTEAWFAYIEAAVFEGGCFFTNTALELDDLDQPEVLGEIRRLYSAYLTLVEDCAAKAIADGHLAGYDDPKHFVLLLHGLEAGALVRHALGEEDAYRLARAAALRLLAEPVACRVR